jgi:hypothetical protein
LGKKDENSVGSVEGDEDLKQKEVDHPEIPL